MQEKICSKCGEVKPLDEFYASKNNGDGKRADCKQCVAKWQKANADHNREIRRKRTARLAAREMIPQPEYKECPACHQVKPIDAFSNRKEAKDGKEHHCRDCMAHARRRRAYGLTPGEFASLLRDQGNSCALCGGGPGHEPWHVDHDHSC